jgi:murein DD-endopeptidase MepM/ murein hydrolase activator NlpD
MINYKKILGAMTATLMCTSIFFGSFTQAQAAVRMKNANGTYTVRSGDSLWYIAQDFGTSIQSLKSLNGLKSDSIIPGQVLRITSAAATPASRGTTAAKSINITRGSKGSQVKLVQDYLKALGFLKGSSDGVYGLQTATATAGFQRAKGIFANGVIDTNTYNALVNTYNSKKTASASASTTIVSANRGDSEVGGAVAYDWWSSVSGELFPKGAVAKVTDIETRKVFYIKRTYGTNHADCEALTLEDTNIIKSIWGGFSWDRRAVVIEVNNYRIAASIAAMPHAGLDKYAASVTVSGRSGGYGTGTNLDGVKDNGMNGVIDVHFLNSKTHGSNKVDAKHQAAIKAAIGK